jgi:micrococcal nuclease
MGQRIDQAAAPAVRRGVLAAVAGCVGAFRRPLLALLALTLAACDQRAFERGRERHPAAPPPARGGESRAAPAGATARLTGTVTRVGDGDSLVVSLGNGELRDVRLHAIDAPEVGQPGGREAADHLRRSVMGRRVELALQGVDPYGRHLAVATGEGGDLGLLQIQGGHAWHNVRYAREQQAAARSRYAAAERTARAARLGLWSSPSPVAPWDFKAGRRAVAERKATDSDAGRATRIVGNRRSGLYHLPGCPGHAAVSPRNAVLFESEETARQAGLRRAPGC